MVQICHLCTIIRPATSGIHGRESYLYRCDMSSRTPWVFIASSARADWIRTSPTTARPATFRATVDDPSQPYVIDLEVATRRGRRPEVLQVVLELRDRSSAGSITTEGLRQVHIARALQLALDQATKPETNQDLVDTDELAGQVDNGARPVRGTPISQAFLEMVVASYRSTVASGSRRPVVDLAVQLRTSRSSAGRWVVQARRAGLWARPRHGPPARPSRRHGQARDPRPAQRAGSPAPHRDPLFPGHAGLA